MLRKGKSAMASGKQRCPISCLMNFVSGASRLVPLQGLSDDHEVGPAGQSGRGGVAFDSLIEDRDANGGALKTPWDRWACTDAEGGVLRGLSSMSWIRSRSVWYLSPIGDAEVLSNLPCAGASSVGTTV